MKRRHIWWAVAGLAITAVISDVIYFWRDYRDLWHLATMPEMSMVELVSRDGKHHLYLKERSWGITGDERAVVVSESARLLDKPDHSTEYAYLGLSEIFYTFNNDTLAVFSTHPSEVPPDLHTPIAIVQVKLSNEEYWDLLQNFNAKGLKKIPPIRVDE